MRIDAHQHYWRLDRNEYGWITPEMKALYRDFLPNDLTQHLKEQSMDRTIVVQAAPTIAETEFILGLGDQTESIAGIVGWLDLSSSQYREQFHRFRNNPKFVGFRVMIQGMEDADDILQPAMIEAFQFFAEQDFPIDLLLYARQLPSLLQLLERVPNLRGVVDHIAKPDIASQQLEPWKSQMKQVAAYPSIYCKLSGMVTEADHENWEMAHFHAYIRHAIDVFGTGRVMFGSDWPVCLLAASYEQVIEILTNALPNPLSEKELAGLFGHNALAFYKLQHLLPATAESEDH
jgi:L-fuconolactonase